MVDDYSSRNMLLGLDGLDIFFTTLPSAEIRYCNSFAYLLVFVVKLLGTLAIKLFLKVSIVELLY